MLSLDSLGSKVAFVVALAPPFLGGGAVGIASPDAICKRPAVPSAGWTAPPSYEQIVVPGGLESRRSCTIVCVADGDNALAGNNEDWTGLFAKMHFIPASKGKFGRVYFGFDVVRWPQGGMNDQGLFFDGATAESVDVPRDPSKPDHGHEKGLIFKAMEECVTVDEVLEYFARYDRSGRQNGQYLVGDRLGNSAIIEPLSVIRKTGRYQVITNFLQSRTPTETSQDPRYRLAARLLEENDGVSVDLMRRVLNATHYEEYSGSMTVTLYSYICDLKRGEIYVYNFHDFEEVAKINLRHELTKGERVLTIASLFPYETFAEKRYKAWRIVGLLRERAIENGLEGPDGVIAYYRELRSGTNAHTSYEVSESQLNAVGYLLLQEGKTGLAIGIFELCAAEHPESANAYDSLGEAYAASGEKELAIKNYERSLELDPSNDNARRMLEDLRR